VKILASADHAGGTITVTTDGIDSVDSHETIHIPWSDCLAATWNDPQLTVTTLHEGSRQQRAWLLSDAGQVPQAVRDRVSSTVVMDLVRTFEPGGEVRFVARRKGEHVVWDILANDPKWMATDLGQRSVTSALAEIRSTLGV
jgi:hypothetical protein